MVQWPPPPSVEDEATSLAKEHGLKDVAETLNTTDQLVPSRGDVDQHPVIMDSDTNTEILVKEASSSSRRAFFSKRAEQPCVAAVFQDETGLPTPPPSDSEARGRPHVPYTKNDKDEVGTTPRSKSTTRVDERCPSRPAVSRIHTDVAGELHRMNAGTRRAPSPYSYNREAGTFRVDSTSRRSTDSFLSPANATASPISMPSTTRLQERSARYTEGDSSTDSEQRSKKSLRFTEARQDTVTQRHQPAATLSCAAPQPSANSFADSSDSNDRRRYVRADEDGSTRDVPRKSHRSRSRPARAVSNCRGSPYSSSAEESVRGQRYGSTKKPSSDDQPVPHRSSHRRERSRLDETPSHNIAAKMAEPSDDDAKRRVYHVRDGRSTMTPPTVTKRDHLEDCFSKAIQDDTWTQSRYTPPSSVDEATIVPLPMSPPCTPRADRSNRQDYYELSLPSPYRTPQRSRGPSIDETQFKESRGHTSLLSQATSTAAALASKTSPPVSRSASNAIETTFACSNDVLVPKPKSRTSSPQGDRPQHFDTSTYAEQAMPKIMYPPVPQPKRPSTRDGLPKIELFAPVAIHAPQRNASWNGHDQQYRLQGPHFEGPLHTTTAMSTTLPSQLSAPSPIYRSQSASLLPEPTPKVNDFTLPPCPRAHPTQGLRDWSTFRDIPSLDICPKCMQALAITRYRSFLTRSLDKPYDKATICSFSKPWIRMAFIQSVKQNKSDLSFVKKASVLPEGARACEGSRLDVRMWWTLIDPATDRAVPEFFACSACVGSVHQIFPDLPDQFRRDVLNQEKSCSLHPSSKHFGTFMEHLDQIAEKCRDRGKSSARYMQPFIDHIRRITRHSECAKDTLLPNRAWHFMNDLPEFAICEACYDEVVWSQREKPVARDISRVTKIVPHPSSRSSNAPHLSSNSGVGTRPISCQLYSERMRKMFADVVSGRISFEMFRNRVRERHAAQYRLTDMNRMYEEDQRMGWDRRDDIEKNRQYWRRLE